MFFLYDILIRLASGLLHLLAAFSSKLRLFVSGRKQVFATLSQKIGPDDRTVWFHAASLGEYEQGLPVMLAFKQRFPQYKIVLTFFSPSGFEVRKNNEVATVTVYLPMDTRPNVKRFLDLVHPEMAFLIKYEYWPNYLRELKNRNVRTFLISGIFRKDQVFFKPYGQFYRRVLDSFEHFFVQNAASKELLGSLGKHEVSVSGDTRFDRVAAILEKDNSLEFMERFVDGRPVVVAGSSWPKDEKLLADYINRHDNAKFIIAPHNIKPAQISELLASIKRPVLTFSEKDSKDPADHEVFVIDTIGILTKIYSYADIAYVGGGFGNPGVHNLLEPATFGVPIVTGPNYSHFAEATALVELGGCIPVRDQKQLDDALDLLLQNEEVRFEKGHICSTFVQMNKNATNIIMKHFDADGDL